MNIDRFMERVTKSGISFRFEPPLMDEELSSWQREHPGSTLPADLLAMLRRFNGLRLDLRAGDAGYFALIPLREYKPVRQALYGEHVDREPSNEYLREDWPDSRLAISYHADGSYLIACDTEQGTFFDADAYDSPRPISSTLEGLFDWIDKHWLEVLLKKPN